MLAVLVAGVFLFMRDKKPNVDAQACTNAFDMGMKALASKDMDTARLQMTTANGVCQGDARSKAASLQAAVERADTSRTACQRSFFQIEGLLDEHKLSSARTAIKELSSACAADPDAGTWRSRLAAGVTAAQGAQASLRAALDAKDLAQAKSSLQQLTNANRENPDLAALKAEVDQLAAAVAATAESAVAAAPAAAPAAVTPAPVVEAPPAILLPAPRERSPARRADVENAPNPKADMAAAFLHDAETALGQKKFDAARTYVDSARRMDPNNPRLDSMTQQIRERERQVLQQETTIR